MDENNLLNYRYNYSSPARRVVESTVSVLKSKDVWEMDIKYLYIHGENRTAYLFATINSYTREVVGKHIGYHCTSQDVKMVIDFAFEGRGIMQIKNVSIRSDNGTHFANRMVELLLSSSNIYHESIYPATPKEDAHIESFNTILEKEVIRLHSAIDYQTPIEIYAKGKDNIIDGTA